MRSREPVCTSKYAGMQRFTPLSGSASPLLMTGHRQVISFIRKGIQNILMYNFIITTFDCQGGGISARANALARPGVAPQLTQLGVCVKYLSASMSM